MGKRKSISLNIPFSSTCIPQKAVKNSSRALNGTSSQSNGVPLANNHIWVDYGAQMGLYVGPICDSPAGCLVRLPMVFQWDLYGHIIVNGLIPLNFGN